MCKISGNNFLYDFIKVKERLYNFINCKMLYCYVKFKK